MFGVSALSTSVVTVCLFIFYCFVLLSFTNNKVWGIHIALRFGPSLQTPLTEYPIKTGPSSVPRRRRQWEIPERGCGKEYAAVEVLQSESAPSQIVQWSCRIMGLYLVFLLVGFLIGGQTVRTAGPWGIPSSGSAIIGGDYSASTGNTVLQKLHYWLQW